MRRINWRYYAHDPYQSKIKSLRFLNFQNFFQQRFVRLESPRDAPNLRNTCRDRRSPYIDIWNITDSYGFLRVLRILWIFYGSMDLKTPASQEIRPISVECIRDRGPKSFRIYSLVVFGHVRSYMIIIHRSSNTILFVYYSSNFLL